MRAWTASKDGHERTVHIHDSLSLSKLEDELLAMCVAGDVGIFLSGLAERKASDRHWDQPAPQPPRDRVNRVLPTRHNRQTRKLVTCFMRELSVFVLNIIWERPNPFTGKTAWLLHLLVVSTDRCDSSPPADDFLSGSTCRCSV